MAHDYSKANYEEFWQLCEPLMQWLNDNCHPHVKVILDSVTAELVEGLTSHRLEPNYSTPYYTVSFGTDATGDAVGTAYIGNKP